MNKWKPMLLTLTGALILLTPSWHAGGAVAETPPERGQLQAFQGIDQLQELFNRDVGVPRIVLLLSPT